MPLEPQICADLYSITPSVLAISFNTDQAQGPLRALTVMLRHMLINGVGSVAKVYVLPISHIQSLVAGGTVLMFDRTQNGLLILTGNTMFPSYVANSAQSAFLVSTFAAITVTGGPASVSHVRQTLPTAPYFNTGTSSWATSVFPASGLSRLVTQIPSTTITTTSGSTLDGFLLIGTTE